MKNSDNERLKKAALDGVISRLESNQMYFVVRFMSKCFVPEAVYESKKVRELSLRCLKRSFGYLGLSADEGLKTVANLMKAVRVPESEVNKAVLDYFAECLANQKRLPRDFENILETFPVPVADLNKNRKLQSEAIAEINSGVRENMYQRQLCFLRYFSLPPEAINSMVRSAFIFYAYMGKDKEQFDEFIKVTGLNRGKILSQLSKVVSYLIGKGEIEKVEMLINKYELTNTFFLNESNRKLAIEGVLEQFEQGEMKEAQKIINLFALSKADFEESTLLKAIESCLSYQKFDAVGDLIIFADLPYETTSLFIRSKLEELVLMDAAKLRLLTEKYAIGWDEVVRAAENALINGLARSGSKYVKRYIDGYGLSKEFLASERVIDAAREGLIKVYKNTDVNDDIGFLVRTFNLSK